MYINVSNKNINEMQKKLLTISYAKRNKADIHKVINEQLQHLKNDKQ